MQFSRCHGDMELTAMTFDPSGRRLITGGRDGSLKIWNFNNGACLNVLGSRFTLEVIPILSFPILSYCHKSIPHTVVLSFSGSTGDITVFSKAEDLCWWLEPNALCLQVQTTSHSPMNCLSQNSKIGHFCKKQRVTLSRYSDTRDADGTVPKCFGGGEHREDILCLAGQEPNLLASASYDGDILLWNVDSERCVGRLNAGCPEKRRPRPVFG